MLVLQDRGIQINVGNRSYSLFGLVTSLKRLLHRKNIVFQCISLADANAIISPIYLMNESN